MPKLKTHKATIKRFRYTGAKKIRRRKAGQDHFNARESGKITKLKRRDVNAHKTSVKTIKKLTPYS
ncbi:50S ribosomal protein L35 [Patescibacteria group bacterium]|nr:50S ribosomal protein L35 [Patescibacteria group bacterium]MBU0963842.1 50S ribosomal protein L35 [Patescibacteria group bacterium]